MSGTDAGEKVINKGTKSTHSYRTLSSTSTSNDAFQVFGITCICSLIHPIEEKLCNYAHFWQHFEAGNHVPKEYADFRVAGLLDGRKDEGEVLRIQD